MRRIKARGKAERARKIRGGIGSSSHCAKTSSGENRRRGAEAMSRRYLPILMRSHHMTSAGKKPAKNRGLAAGGFFCFFLFEGGKGGGGAPGKGTRGPPPPGGQVSP